MMNVEMCSALGTEAAILFFETVQRCGEFRPETCRDSIPVCLSHVKCLCWCFRIRAVSGNHTDERQLNRKGTDSPSGSFPDVPTSVQLISVWVRVQNPLGSAKSSAINYTLRDIGKANMQHSAVLFLFVADVSVVLNISDHFA